MGIADTYDLLIVGNANVYPAALRVGEAAYPFQIFVAPRLFVLYVLILSHILPLLDCKGNNNIRNRG